MTDNDGKIVEEYKIDNTEENWADFMKKYNIDTEISVEKSTAGKYVIHLLRDHGLHVHLANSKELKLIWKSKKKTDKNDAGFWQDYSAQVIFLNINFQQKR